MTAHAKYSASAAERWTNCPGSVRECAPYGRTGTAPAAQGTFAHHIAATCLLDRDGKTRPIDWLGNSTIIDGFRITCDPEMVEGVQFYLDDCAADEQPGDLTWTEMPLLSALQKIHPELGGTADRVRWRPSARHLRVTDFKFGAGVFVDATGNKQMKLYALGALLEAGVKAKTVEVRVVQPRYEQADALARSFEFDAVDLLDFAADILDAIRAAEAPDAPLVPGAWCKKTFCPAAALCPALTGMQTALMQVDTAAVTVYDKPKLLQALDMIEPLKAKIRALQEFAYVEANAGRLTEDDGWKLVEKKPVRRWREDDKAAVAEWAIKQGIDPYEEPTLRSPAQLEALAAVDTRRGQKKQAKAEARAALAQFTESKSSGLTLVRTDDARPNARLLSADDYAALPPPVEASSLFD